MRSALIFYSRIVFEELDAMMGKVDNAAAILELAMNQTALKVLQEKCNLSRGELEEHLKMLVSKDLIIIAPGDKKVMVTKRGVQFLDLYKSMRSRYLTVPA